MDAIDNNILALLQEDASLSIAEMAARVGLSQTPCWKRIQKLEAAGVIQRRVALLSPEKLGFGLSVYVSIVAGEHSDAWLERFTKSVAEMPEVLEFHRMAGDVDYMLRVVVTDMIAFDEFYKRLIAIAPLRNVVSRFAMERIKTTTALPLETSAANATARRERIAQAVSS
jgi:Lrp/AsnC family transcriptional regulator